MTEKEKDNFVSGKYLICLIDFKIFKKNQSYWLEYNPKASTYGNNRL